MSITECSPIPANVPIFGVSSVLGYLLDAVIWGPSKRLPRLSTSQLMQVAASTKFISLGQVPLYSEPNTIRGNRTPACKSAVFLCSEAKAEINAGMIIITNCRLQRSHAATEPATSMAKGLLGSRQGFVRSSHPSPNVDQLASSGLLWTPMATAIATLPVHWTHAWALLAEWANHITFPLPKASPDGKIVWPRHGSADLLGQTYQTRSPPFVMWAFPAFMRNKSP